MTIREQVENFEKRFLSEKACLSSSSRGRKHKEDLCEIRTCFQRDRDRILHCKTFRRLKHKTQVFLAPVGDHYRTRLTHTLEVSQIARTIARALRLNEDLTESIALGHDLGHTPFGHAGEEVLNKLVGGGFKHYFQSGRVVEFLEKKGKGLNLSIEVIDGIVKHSKGKTGDLEGKNLDILTMEGKIVRVSDIVAYLNHDCDDAVRAGVIKENNLPEKVRKVFGKSHRERVGNIVKNIIETCLQSEGTTDIIMSPDFAEVFHQFKMFMYDEVYHNKKVKNEFYKSEKILEFLFEELMKNPHKHIQDFYFKNNDPVDRIVADFISGMTDNYAVNMFKELFIPKRWFG
jgi:dGTPase